MGKKSKIKSIGQLLIDLTPLLDVVFLLLMVVLCYQDNYKDTADTERMFAEEQASQAMLQMEAVESRNEALENRVDFLQKTDSYIEIVTVYATYNSSNRKSRTIHILSAAGEQTIPLTPSNSELAWEECRSSIAAVLDANAADTLRHPVLLNIQDSKMLYRDYKRLSDIYSELCGSYDNLYLRDMTENGNE